SPPHRRTPGQPRVQGALEPGGAHLAGVGMLAHGEHSLMTRRVPELPDRRGHTEDAQVLPAARVGYDEVILGLGTEMAATLHEGLAARADRVLVVTWPMPNTVDMVAQRHRALQHTAHLWAERCHLVINPTPRH